MHRCLACILGSLNWSYTPEPCYLYSSPSIVDGVVYFGGVNPGRLYAVGSSISVIPLPGITNLPTDPDDDGLFEDLNSNGFADGEDAVVLFWEV